MVTPLQGDAKPPKPSVVVVSPLATVDKQRLTQKIGTLPKPTVDQIAEGCRMVLARQMF